MSAVEGKASKRQSICSGKSMYKKNRKLVERRAYGPSSVTTTPPAKSVGKWGFTNDGTLETGPTKLAPQCGGHVALTLTIELSFTSMQHITASQPGEYH